MYANKQHKLRELICNIRRMNPSGSRKGTVPSNEILLISFVSGCTCRGVSGVHASTDCANLQITTTADTVVLNHTTTSAGLLVLKQSVNSAPELLGKIGFAHI